MNEMKEKDLEKTELNSDKSKKRRRCCRRPTLCEVLLAIILAWGSVVLSVYLMDLPAQGGSDDFCDSFYIAPDSNDPTYPYSNTFDVGAPISWDGSGQKDALNKYRIVGTHNSYHVMQYPGSPTYWANWWALYIKDWRYEHPDFIKQLDSGWRNFELDFHMRPKATVIYHLQMWDQLSRCACLNTCLKQLNDWSNINPNHFPVYIILEPKVVFFSDDSWVKNNDIELKHILHLEQQILNVFGDKILPPDMIRNGEKTVKDSIDKNGWPKIDEFMGRFIFILWDMDEKTTKIREMYSENTDGLKGRLFFTSFYEYEKENHDETMFVHMDDPDVDAITELRKEGYITRTRINTETEVDADRYKKALDSGSQIISFDQEYSYSWSLFENHEKCSIQESSIGKVCHWND